MLPVHDGVIDAFGVKFNVEEANINMENEEDPESSPFQAVSNDDQGMQVAKGAEKRSKSLSTSHHSHKSSSKGESPVTDSHSEIYEKEVVDSGISPVAVKERATSTRRMLWEDDEIDLCMDREIAEMRRLEEKEMEGCDSSQILSLMQLLEWSLFEILTTVLLSLIFFWLTCGSGVSHLKTYLKERGTPEQ